MEEQPADGAEDPGPGPAAGPAPDGPEARALAAEADEIRRLVEAGAGSPEDLRILAARIRDHRAREEALWRAQVKPQLVKARKGTFALGHLREPKATEPTSGRSSLVVGAVLLVGVLLVVLLAASTSIVLLLVPILALLGYAWWQGRQGPSTGPPPG